MNTIEREQAEERFAARFANFTLDEMRCKCGECHLPIDDPEFESFCENLQALRVALGFPFHITSFYRCPAYNDSLYSGDGTKRDGPHTKGAADQLISFERMYKLIDRATTLGFGVGVKQHGPINGRYVHLDHQGARLWTYR